LHITIAQLAKILGVNKVTAFEKIKRGQIRVIRSGRKSGKPKYIGRFFPYILPRNPKPLIPTIKLSEVIPKEISSIKIYKEIPRYANISALELIVITKLIRYYNARNIFEIGTLDGRTTLNMAANCSQKAKIYTLDLPKVKLHYTKLPLNHGDKMYFYKEITGSRFFGNVYAKKITQLYGDSATFDFSPFTNTMDFIFIDGLHSCEYVLNDSTKALQLVRNNKGIIVWHDYMLWSGVTRALNALYLNFRVFKRLKHIEGTSLVCWVIQ
jgi:hypothetical protein